MLHIVDHIIGFLPGLVHNGQELFNIHCALYIIVVVIFQPPLKSRHEGHFVKLTTILPNQIHIYSWEAVTTTKIIRLQPSEILATWTLSLDLYKYSSNEKEEENIQTPDHL